MVVHEIDNLAANMLTGVLSLTLLKLLADREAEKTRLESQVAGQPATSRPATIRKHPGRAALPSGKRLRRSVVYLSTLHVRMS